MPYKEEVSGGRLRFELDCGHSASGVSHVHPRPQVSQAQWQLCLLRAHAWMCCQFHPPWSALRMYFNFYGAVNFSYRPANSSLSVTNSIFLSSNLTVGNFVSVNRTFHVSPPISIQQSISVTSSLSNLGTLTVKTNLCFHLSFHLDPLTSVCLSISYFPWPITLSISITRTIVVSETFPLTLTCLMSGRLRQPPSTNVSHTTFR